jgi:hypothetical protein
LSEIAAVASAKTGQTDKIGALAFCNLKLKDRFHRGSGMVLVTLAFSVFNRGPFAHDENQKLAMRFLIAAVEDVSRPGVQWPCFVQE